MRKKIAFITPIWDWWPKVLYKDLVDLFKKKYPEYDYFLVSSIKEWINLHFLNNEYDLIISSIPFFWKPPKCIYIVQQHWLYRKDRGFTSIPKLLNWLYPYNNFFSKLVLYPSNFLKWYYNSKHKNQKVVLNFSNLPINKKNIQLLLDKDEINFLTITSFSFYKKAIWILDIFQKLEKLKTNKKINYYICWDWKYLYEIKNKLNNYKISNNIKVIFLLKLDKIKIIELLNKTDIFLYSTFQETFWISIIEAMSFWIPVILNDYELFYELYDQDFISKDNNDFISKLNLLINNSNYYKNYIDKWYKNLEKFNKNIIIDQWYKIIKEQLN